MNPLASKRKLTAWASLAVAATMLVGCTSTAPEESAGGTITFLTYTGGDAGQKYVDLIEQFEEANPGVEVELEVVPGDATYDTLITSRIQAGNAPDVIEILNGLPAQANYSEAGLLLDLSDEPWVERQLPITAEAANYSGGQTYSFISTLYAVGMFYNKDIFEANGVDVPTTWDEFLAAIETFRAAGITPLAVGAKDGWPLGAQAQGMAAGLPDFASGTDTGAELTSGDLAFSETGWSEVLKDFEQLVDLGAFDPDASGITWPASADQFGTGQAAMMIQGSFAIPAIRAADPDLNMGFVPLPYVKDGGEPTVGVTYGGLLSIPTASKNSELAKKFLEFLTSDDVYKQYLTTGEGFSSLQGVNGDIDAAALEIIPFIEAKSVEFSITNGLTPETTAALTAGMQAIIAGSGTAADAIAALDAAQ